MKRLDLLWHCAPGEAIPGLARNTPLYAIHAWLAFVAALLAGFACFTRLICSKRFTLALAAALV